jgi:uncharacterized protein (UPF0264 family)
VAVVYIDSQTARAPAPESVIAHACTTPGCVGVLFDTWKKSTGSRLDHIWKTHIESIRAHSRFVAVAGSLDIDAIIELKALDPDIFAVRGAACIGGDRLGVIDPERVSALARAVAL